MFAVADDEEAKALVILVGNRGGDGELYARELVEDQTLENLEAFSERCDRAHDYIVKAGHCRCKVKAVKRRVGR